MLDTPTESPPYDFVDKRAKLRELTNQSWNLELVISRATLLATLGLADCLDDALTYYRCNLMPDSANKPEIYAQIPFWYVPEN